jgi:hypothetical protein
MTPAAQTPAISGLTRAERDEIVNALWLRIEDLKARLIMGEPVRRKLNAAHRALDKVRSA